MDAGNAQQHHLGNWYTCPAAPGLPQLLTLGHSQFPLNSALHCNKQSTKPQVLHLLNTVSHWDKHVLKGTSTEWDQLVLLPIPYNAFPFYSFPPLLQW